MRHRVMHCFVARSLVVCVLAISVLSGATSWAPAFGRVPDSREGDRGVDRKLLRQTVDSLAAVVEREYFDAEVSARVARAVKEERDAGRYDGIASLDSLAAALTADMYKITRDKHLAVTLVPGDPSAGPRSGAPRPSNADSLRALRGRRDNYGIQEVQILPGNIGYLNLTSFYRREEASDGIAAAMSLLQHADALILDLRANGGGSPGTVAFLAGYLFDEPAMPLFDIVPRSGEGGRAYAIDDTLPAEHNGTRPMYILTSRASFSAGEGFAFLLQERRRAEVVGEQTAGAANPGRPYRLNDLLVVTVPNGRIRSAVAGGNWEGNGVLPDVPVPASEALRVTQRLALETLIERSTGAWRDSLVSELGRLQNPER